MECRYYIENKYIVNFNRDVYEKRDVIYSEMAEYLKLKGIVENLPVSSMISISFLFKKLPLNPLNPQIRDYIY